LFVRAMVQNRQGEPLRLTTLAQPVPGPRQALIKVETCAVCRTDLHVVDGELPDIPYPVIPGHQVVGRVATATKRSPPVGARVGVPWLGFTCGKCDDCRRGMENLCDEARFTGYTLPGGYAEYLAVDERFCLPVDDQCDAVATAPLLCGGLIGYRALTMTGEAQRVGLYGFGAAAHILAQVLNHQGKSFYAFTRPGDLAAQALARELGAHWAGDSDTRPDQPLDAAIIFAPVGSLVPTALSHVRKGGIVVCGGIHMSDIPSFPYEILWGERQLRSVANLTRRDGIEFLTIAAAADIHARTRVFPLEQANQALEQLRSGRITGSAVLRVHEPAAASD